MPCLTPRKVRKFWEYMSAHYKTTILEKDDDLKEIIDAAKGKNIIGVLRGIAELDYSDGVKNMGDEIYLIAMFLEKVIGLDVDTFMNEYSTSLGRRIYIPFEIGESTDRFPLDTQVVICTHEHQHVVQYRKDRIAFVIRYLADRAQRALYEAEAFRCNLEIENFLHGKVPRVEGYAAGLKNYGCTDDDVAVVEKALRLSKQTIEAGGITTASSKVALRWLKKNL